MWSAQLPLDSDRPPSLEKERTAKPPENSVRARLWEDPLGAVHDPGAKTDGDLSFEHLLENLTTSAESADTADTHIMIAIVREGPYSEDIESRVRFRYATTMGLAAEGYSPVDGRFLHFFDFEAKPSNSTSKAPNAASNDSIFVATSNYVFFKSAAPPKPSNGKNSIVPCEFFEHHEKGRPKVTGRALVLWMNDELLADSPLNTLSEFVSKIKKVPGEGLNINWSAAKISIIGPPSSTMLKKMQEEVSTSAPAAPLNGVTMYSPFATTPDSIILGPGTPKDIADDARRARIAKHLMENWGLQFVSTTPPDDLLAAAMIGELRKRRFLCPKPNSTNPSNVVLIAESDELYGRTIRRTFLNNLPEETQPRDGQPHPITNVIYLKGVDGERGLGEDHRRKEKGSQVSTSVSDIEKPEGPKQIDYIRRVAQRLAPLSTQGEVAVGVIGVDIYDKLLLIKAIKNTLPNAVIFTFDLDAALLHPEALPYTRNLLVASGYGLELKSELQEGIPPFRDTYQTSTFVAVRAAIEQGSKEDPSNKEGSTNKILKAIHDKDFSDGLVRLYEVGRKTPVDLSEVIDSRMHPTVTTWKWPGSSLLWGGVIVAIVVLTGIPLIRIGLRANLMPHVIGTAEERKRGRMHLRHLAERRNASLDKGLFIVGTLTVLLLLAIAIDQKLHGEPFCWINGVSIWPTELTRMLAVACCAVFVVFFRYSIAKTDVDLACRFGTQLSWETKPQRHEGYLHRIIDTLRNEWKLIGATKLPRVDNGTVAAVLSSLDQPPQTPQRERWLEKLKCWYHDHISISSWAITNPIESAQKIWENYNARGHLRYRLWRTAVTVFIYVMAGLSLCFLWGFPVTPVRGGFAYFVDKVVLCLSVLSLVSLIAVMLDTVRLGNTTIKHLADHPTRWSPNSRNRFFERSSATLINEKDEVEEHDNDLEEIRLIEEDVMENWVIGRATEHLSSLVYLPFIVILIMVASRSWVFDQWTWPPALITIMACNSIISVVAFVLLRITAQNSRASALDRLRQGLYVVQARAKAQRNDDLIDRYELAIKQIEENREGAFRPILEDPIWGAILLPFLGPGLEVFMSKLPISF